jgi:hypothetical protein
MIAYSAPSKGEEAMKVAYDAGVKKTAAARDEGPPGFRPSDADKSFYGGICAVRQAIRLVCSVSPKLARGRPNA